MEVATSKLTNLQRKR